MKSSFFAVLMAGAALGCFSAQAMAAEIDISIYGGYQTSPHSEVDITGPSQPQRFNAGFEGRSFEMPPYYGVRGTWWLQQKPEIGLSIDFTHAKVYGDDATLTANGLDTFELTDCIISLTLKALFRYRGF